MANMSYCRFENTVNDMDDCINVLYDVVYDGEEISDSEKSYAKRFITLCKKVAEEFDNNCLDKDSLSNDSNEEGL
jgi:hypothetical protein